LPLSFTARINDLLAELAEAVGPVASQMPIESPTPPVADESILCIQQCDRMSKIGGSCREMRCHMNDTRVANQNQ